jgi:hypothetical protein
MTPDPIGVPESAAAAVTRLVAEAADLRETIAGLRADLRASNDARHRNQRRTWATIVLDVSLSLLGLWLYHSVIVTQQSEERTRTQVLCPLYQESLAQITPAARAAVPVAQRGTYDAEVKIIEGGYRVLRCQPAVPGP